MGRAYDLHFTTLPGHPTSLATKTVSHNLMHHLVLEYLQ